MSEAREVRIEALCESCFRPDDAADTADIVLAALRANPAVLRSFQGELDGLK